mgnify:CR=1 FL=1
MLQLVQDYQHHHITYPRQNHQNKPPPGSLDDAQHHVDIVNRHESLPALASRRHDEFITDEPENEEVGQEEN